MVFTSHLRRGDVPVVLREGFSWGAFAFGFLYLTVHRAWIAAVLNLAVLLLASAATQRLGSGAPLLGLAVLQGVFGRDLRRWSLERRGFADGPVIAAPNSDQALLRLLDARADLLPGASGARG